MPTRRALLASGALVALAGCSAFDGANARLARIRIRNESSTTRTFELTVALDGETVYDETHTVGRAGEGASVELTGELPDEPGEITVETTLGDADVSESTTFDDDSCHDVIVEYTDDNLSHWQSASGEGCEAFVAE